MLSVHDLSVAYPNGVVALKKTDLSFTRGQFTVLLGPSGAGKSTLLRSLNGLARPTSGEVRTVDGKPINHSRAALRDHRRATGMVFQQHHLIGRLTALRNVLIGRLSAHSFVRSFAPMPRMDRLIALEALERVGLADRALARADQLSGGQQQRVGIARAMAQRPQIILADEPVASLDPASSTKVLADLHRICREDGLTTIVSLHQVDLARRFADRIIGLCDGAVVFDGKPEEMAGDALASIYGGAPTSLRHAAE